MLLWDSGLWKVHIAVNTGLRNLKLVLSLTSSRSLAIDHLRDTFTSPKAALAYFYFNYQDSDGLSAEVVLRSLLKQLLLTRERLPEQIRELRRRTESQERALQREDLEQALLIACGDLDHTYVVIGEAPHPPQMFSLLS